jgi:hypothetical protein
VAGCADGLDVGIDVLPASREVDDVVSDGRGCHPTLCAAGPTERLTLEQDATEGLEPVPPNALRCALL